MVLLLMGLNCCARSAAFLKTTPARTVSKSAPRGSPQDNLEYIRQQLSKKSPKGLLKSQPASPSSKARPAAEVKPVQSASAVALAQLTDQQAGKSKQSGSTPGKKSQAAASAAPVKATGTVLSLNVIWRLSVSCRASDFNRCHRVCRHSQVVRQDTERQQGLIAVGLHRGC